MKIFNKYPGNVSTGPNTVIELDGKPLSGVTFLKIELKPAKIAKVTIEMMVEMESIELDCDLKLIGQKDNPKLVHTISKFESEPVSS